MMSNHGGVCILCGGLYGGYGHNPEPIVDYDTGRCCDDCNSFKVIPARLDSIVRSRPWHPSQGR